MHVCGLACPINNQQQQRQQRQQTTAIATTGNSSCCGDDDDDVVVTLATLQQTDFIGRSSSPVVVAGRWSSVLVHGFVAALKMSTPTVGWLVRCVCLLLVRLLDRVRIIMAIFILW